MFPRGWRLGIRAQLTVIVILGAVLSTVATLFIADNAIQNYVSQQAQTQEIDNMKIANLVLQTRYGENISIDTSGQMVVDSPTSDQGISISKDNNFGRYVLNGDPDYVDYVSHLIDNSVSLYQCADRLNNFQTCTRIATTFANGTTSTGAAKREVGSQFTLSPTVAQHMSIGSTPHEWQGEETIDGRQYYSDYAPIFNPQQQFIGVISVAVPLDTITTVVTRTAIELILIGTIIMVAGIVLALFFASTIVGTLQRAARQVSGASERIGTIAAQQANGSAQQVWAINAINQALQNFSETAQDIAQRTDQLALMGNQVLQRRSEISPAQIDSILAYITRSVRDISVASRQQAAQYERMTGAMQAVIEIAEQVAGSSQQSTESSERLELVVRQLRQLVGVRLLARPTASEAMGIESMPSMMGSPSTGAGQQGPGRRTVRAVRPARRAAEQSEAPAMAGAMGQMPNAMAGAGNMMVPAEAMSGARGRGGMGNMGAMGGAGRMGAPAGNSRSMNGNGSMMAGPNTRGAQRGGMGMGGNGRNPAAMGGFNGDPDAYDWRLPPMPEMPPLPNLGNMQIPMRTSDSQDPNGAPYGRPSRGGRSNYGGMSGPNGGSNRGGNDDGWPMSMRDSYDPYGRGS